MVSTKKMNVISNIQKNDNYLETYLKNYDISKELFNGNVKNVTEQIILRRYYDSACEKARRLVTDDEYVGITYDNLNRIKNKLIIKR